jgi:diguanylate cyclase (GGDEF)-like protein
MSQCVFLWGDHHELRRALAEADDRVADLEACLADRSRTDPRTGLLTVEAFHGDAEAVIAHAVNAEQPASLALVDIDDFRSLNARRGTAAGDPALLTVAGRLRALTRTSDVLGRTGADELAVLVPGTTLKGARACCDRLTAELAAALTERDSYTGEHSASVVETAWTVAAALGLDAIEVEHVGHAALLHDIGKVGGPDRILHKSGPLAGDEWELMREHPLIGERILRAIPGMGGVARMVRHEHERLDGGGYPDGLRGEEIPIGSRIILACDAYHAITSDRSYRDAMPHHEAVAELVRGAAAPFDPRVVSSLLTRVTARSRSSRTPSRG